MDRLAQECAIEHEIHWTLGGGLLCYPRWREVLWSATPTRRHLPLAWLDPASDTAPKPDCWDALTHTLSAAVADLPPITLTARHVLRDHQERCITQVLIERTPQLDQLAALARNAMRQVYGTAAVRDPGDLWQPHIPVPFHDPTEDLPDPPGDAVPLRDPAYNHITAITQVRRVFPPANRLPRRAVAFFAEPREADHPRVRRLGQRLARAGWFHALTRQPHVHHPLCIAASDPR